jgi:hypothetical protein
MVMIRPEGAINWVFIWQHVAKNVRRQQLKNFGVLEHWSNDDRIDVFFFNTPILHHSSTPRPRLSRTFGNL